MVEGRLKFFASWMADHGVYCLGRMKHEHLTEFLEDGLKGKAASYQTYTWTTVKSFLRWCDHPLGRKYHYSPTGRDRQVVWMTPEQMDFLLSQRLTPREGLIVCAGLYAGLRRCEVMRLTIADLSIAWTHGRLSVRGKGGKIRPVPVHPDFQEAIGVYLASVDREPGEKALPFTEDHYSVILQKLQERTGIPCASHVLRRSFLRFLNKKGVPIATISAIAGHSSTEMTLRYIGAPMDDMQAAIEEIPSRYVRKTVHLST